MFNIIKKIEKMPVGIIATAVGAATLGNVYAGLDFTYVRHILMIMGLVIFFLGTIKLTLHSTTFLEEYNNTILASLYGTFSMLSMILGSYIYPIQNTVGKTLWLFGIIFHTLLILIFTYKNVIRNFNLDTFTPSWFVTYNGIMVSIVIGQQMGMYELKKIILYYGIGVFLLIIPFMIIRLIIRPLPDNIYHVTAILLAPSSLCVVSYLEVIKDPNVWVISILYSIVFITIILVLTKIPKFFSFDFHPGFASTTFPMAIGVVASLKMSGYLNKLDLSVASNIIKNVAGIQIFITTGIIIFIYYNFLKKAIKI